MTPPVRPGRPEELADEAVRHALAAGEVVWAARLVERHVEALLRRSEGGTLGRWLSALPPDAVGSRARLCLAQAVSAVVGGQLELPAVARIGCLTVRHAGTASTPGSTFG
jgi:ATP/maltotriose-dependent transcriptional regulator MalT